jgi:hypothetical protein
MSSASTRHVATRGRQAAAEVGFEVRAIHGRVFPAKQGSPVAIELRTRQGWRTVRRVRVARDGSYAAWLSTAGRYRAVYRRVAGPAVPVG